MLPPYTGRLRRGASADTVEGELVDAFGFVLRITGTRDGAGYVLTATVDVPAVYRMPMDPETVDPGQR